MMRSLQWLFRWNSRDYRRDGVNDATRAWSLVKRFIATSAFPEAFFQVPIWRIEQESVVAAMPVLLDSGSISGISLIQPCLVSYEDNALAPRRRTSRSRSLPPSVGKGRNRPDL